MIIKNVDSLADIHSNSIFHGGHLGFWKFLNIFFWTTELILFGTPHCTKISKKVSGYQPFLGTPGFQPDYYKEVKEKPTKKIKGGQKLTWHHTIERDFKKIDHTVEQAIHISKNREKYREVVDRIMAEAVAKQFPEDGDQSGSLPGQN